VQIISLIIQQALIIFLVRNLHKVSEHSSSLLLLDEYPVHLFTNAFFCILTPLDTRENIVIDNKAAITTFDLEVI